MALAAAIVIACQGCTSSGSTVGARGVPSPTGSPAAAGGSVSAASALRLPGRVARPSLEPFDSPIRPDNKPNAVAKDVNGMMPARDLVGVAPNCVADRAAAPSLGLLLATAREQGVVLGTSECYRPLSGQVTVRQSWTAAGNTSCAAPVVTTSTGKPKGTSMHGWGKAADFSVPGGSLTFDSAAYAFLTAQAGRFGWNHPGWAQPGGSTCPEAWHWEWVGDGGILRDSRIRADVVSLVPSWDGSGYWTVTGLGAVGSHGDAPDAGSLAAPLAWLVAAAAPTPDGGGYWLVGVDGSVYAFGDAGSSGSTAGVPLPQPVVGIAPASGGDGYWLATSDGQVFGFGAAGSYGSPSASGLSLDRPIVAIVATPDGRGYWLAGAGGKVFPFGDAGRYGGASGRSLPAPVVSMAATHDGRGYWLAGADGSVYPFGDAGSFGSAAHIALREPVVGIAGTPDSEGYWLVAADGSIVARGDAALYRVALATPVVGRGMWVQ